MSRTRTLCAFAASAAALVLFHMWLASLDQLPIRLRIQGVVLFAALVGAWLGLRLRDAAVVQALFAGAVLSVVPLVVERLSSGSWPTDWSVLGFPALVGTCAALAATRALRAWRRVRERSLVWSLTHAHLTVVAVLAGVCIVSLGLVNFDSRFMRTQMSGLPDDAQLAVRIVAGVLPLVVVVSGLAALALPLLIPPALLVSWLAARGMARRVERLMAVEAMADARRDLFARISHELKNPLTVLRAAVDGLRARAPDVTEVAVLDDGVARLTHVVGDLGELARAESDGLRLQLEHVHIARSIDAVVMAHAQLAAQREVLLVTQVEALATPTHRLDRMRFEQVLANLVQNALRHVEPGGIVRLVAASERGRTAVRVEDTGCGIERDALQHVFEPGFSRDGGLGLGLALARELTERMGGALDVESTPGRGTRFTIRL